MTNQPSEDGPDLSDAEMGPPVAELEQLSVATSADFERRVSGRIERRLLTGRLIDAAWSAPIYALLELLRVPFETFSANRRR